MDLKLVSFDTAARRELEKGVNILADAVKVTMGPAGMNVVIERPGATPILTKDGVTVAQSINLRDKFMNLGVQMVKEAASRTAETAGDGTTTATVLAQSIFGEGMRMIAARASAPELKRGIDVGVNAVILSLMELSSPVTDDASVVDVATVSANGERDVGELIGNAIARVGRDGVVTVEEAKGFKTTLDVVEGMQIDRGYLSPYFINKPEKMTCELDNPFVLVTSKKISGTKEIVPLLEKILETGRPVLIVADDVEGEALQALVINKTKGNLQVCAIRAPGFGEQRVGMLDDLSTILGGTVISDAAGTKLESSELSNLGQCRKVIVTRGTTTFVDGAGDQLSIQTRSAELAARAIDPSILEEERSVLRSRAARLVGGVAVIRVGGATEVELRERKDRVDDALAATRAAIAEGTVPGGGTALVRASTALESKELREGLTPDELLGIEIVSRACYAPFKQIIRNAGRSPEIIAERLKSSDTRIVYNVRSDSYVDWKEGGIVDPVMVVRCALENAASAAGMMLTVGCAIVEDSSNSVSPEQNR